MAKKRSKTTEKPADYVLPHLRSRAVALTSVSRDPKNCKTHADKDLTAIMASLRQFGQVRAIIADAATRVILAGNGTHEAAERLGWEQIAVDFVEGWSPEQARAFAFADNRTAQLSEWDQAELASYLADIENVSADLYDALLLDHFLEEPNNSLPTAVEVQEKYGVVAMVPSEAAQQRLFEFLRQHNYTDLRLITT